MIRAGIFYFTLLCFALLYFRVDTHALSGCIIGIYLHDLRTTLVDAVYSTLPYFLSEVRKAAVAIDPKATSLRSLE